MRSETWRTLRRTFSEFSEDNGTDWAAALTYYAVLSMFPALIALVGLVGLVMDPKTLTDALRDIVGQLGPTSAVDTFEGPIDSITSSRATGAVMLVVGLLTALWTASGYVGVFMRASNAMYEVPEGRAAWKLRPLQMLVTLVMILLLAVTFVALIVTGPVASGVGEALGIGDTAVTIYQIAKWPILGLLVMAMLGILYYAAPNARLPKLSWVTQGSVLALVIWAVASAAFAFYVANFGSYDKTYGTLGGVVTFLVWMWITNAAVLLGQELNAEVERTRELEAGTPGAEKRIQLPLRDQPSEKQLPDTARGAHPAPRRVPGGASG
jgi:membrane protein